MRRFLVIGIGAGDPEYVTVQAINAMRRTGVFFMVDKGTDKEELIALRRTILERYVVAGGYRVVRIEEPARDRAAARYTAAVDTWRGERAARYEAAILEHLADGETGAMLVWGDPSLYDSTLAIVEDVVRRGNVLLEVEVIPGISSVQALAARHRVTLNRVGEAIQITTGRRLRDGLPTEAENVVVMLDADCSFRQLSDDDLTITWGAYLGTEDEILVSGPLAKVGAEIERLRAEARARHGWVMDTYLLRRDRRPDEP
jgi:precorrin-6A synthase